MKVKDDAQEFNRRCALARAAALRELVKLYPDDFERLREEMRTSMGLPPAPKRKSHVPLS